MHLLDIVADGIVNHLVRHIAVRHKEIGLFVHFEQLKVLIEAVHHGARVNPCKPVQEVEAALDASFHQSTCKLAGIVGHIVCCNVHTARARCAQPDREALPHIQQHFGDMEARIPDGKASVCFCLLDKLVVCIVEKIFKENQMLQISQTVHPSPFV